MARLPDNTYFSYIIKFVSEARYKIKILSGLIDTINDTKSEAFK